MLSRLLFLSTLVVLTLSAKPIEVTTGTYIYNVYNIDLRNETFEADFWLWFVHDGPDLDLKKKTWIINAPKAKLIHTSEMILPDGKRWIASRWRALFEQELDLSRFPLIIPDLEINVMPVRLYADEVVYVPDTHQSGFFPQINFHDWKFKDLTISNSIESYTSSFGNPRVHSGTEFTMLKVGMRFYRNESRSYVRFFGILYLAVLFLIIAYFLPIEDLASRIGLVVAAIFATIGNNLFINSQLPPVGVLTLVDKMQIAVVILIVLSIFLILTSRFFYRIERRCLQKKIDSFSALFIGGLFASLNLWLFL